MNKKVTIGTLITTMAFAGAWLLGKLSKRSK